MDDTISSKKSIIAYLLIFNILPIIVVTVLTPLFLNMFNIEYELFNQIANSENLLSHLNTQNHDVVIMILNLSSYSNLITYFVLTAVLIFTLRVNIINDLDIFKKDENNSRNILNFFKTVIIYFLIYYGLTIISNMFISILEELLNVGASSNQETIEISLKYTALPMIICTTILGPIAEELVFRKSIFSIFTNKRIALVVSSFSFAIIHVLSSIGQYNFFQLCVLTLPYLSAGFIFGFVYMRTKYNIFTVTAIHMLSNILAVIFIFTL